MRPKISLVTTCKGRLHHLQRTLPTLLGQICDVPWECVLVDFGCPDGAGDWCEAWARDNGVAHRLRVLRARNNTEHFHMARAKNIGGVHAAGDFVAFVDADTFVPLTFLGEAYGIMQSDGLDLLLAGLSGAAVHCESEAAFEFPDREGRCHSYLCPAFRRSAFLELRGHDETFVGWGYEDADLNARATKSGRPWGSWRPALRLLHHSHDDSMRFYAESDKGKTSAANLARGAGTLRDVNPGPWGQL